MLVGHSYGGAVITEAGNHPNVAALAYIAAYAPGQGESLSTLIAEAPSDAPAPPILPPDGFWSCRENSRPPSPPMCPRSWRRSWLTLRSGLASTR